MCFRREVQRGNRAIVLEVDKKAISITVEHKHKDGLWEELFSFDVLPDEVPELIEALDTASCYYTPAKTG